MEETTTDEGMTAAGLLTLFTDFHRQFPDRIVLPTIDTGDTGDDLKITFYDRDTEFVFNGYANDDGSVNGFSMTDPNAPPPIEGIEPFDPNNVAPYIVIPGDVPPTDVNFAGPDSFEFSNWPEPINLIPETFLAGGGGFEGDGSSGAFGWSGGWDYGWSVGGGDFDQEYYGLSESDGIY